VLAAPSAIYAPLAGTAATAGVAGAVSVGAISPVSLAGVTAAQSGVVSVSQGRFVVGPAVVTNWELRGNSGTTSSDFLGTSDQQPLTIRVNQERALWIQPTGVSPNLVGGYAGNVLSNAPVGVAIGGGSGNLTLATGATVGGGEINRAAGAYSTVAGGREAFAAHGELTFQGGTRCA